MGGTGSLALRSRARSATRFHGSAGAALDTAPVALSLDAASDLADQLDDASSAGAVGVLVGVIDGQAAADATASFDGGDQHVGELTPGQATGFVIDIGQPLGCELDSVEYVQVDVEPPPLAPSRAHGAPPLAPLRPGLPRRRCGNATRCPGLRASRR